MKYIVRIEIVDPEIDVIRDAEEIVSCLIDALRDGQCKDAIYTVLKECENEN